MTDYDFLQMLLDELDASGAEYVPVSIAARADVEAPSFTGSPFDGTMGADARDVRLTMRDVVLMHVEDGLTALDEGQAVYDVNLEVPLLGNTISFDRGYQWVDVRAGAQRFRFVNSHFEAFSSDIAYAQAAQLLDEATAEDTTTVFVCDCNSDPLNSSIKPQDTLPHKAAYELITGPGDFTDEWLKWAPAAEGWTSGLSETVDDATGDGLRPPHRHGLRPDGRRRPARRGPGPGHRHRRVHQGPGHRPLALRPRRGGAPAPRPLRRIAAYSRAVPGSWRPSAPRNCTGLPRRTARSHGRARGAAVGRGVARLAHQPPGEG